MKVTFSELYNGEITDLLANERSSSSEDKSKRPISLMEEEIVYSASEIYDLVERGSAKRHTAENLLNRQGDQLMHFVLNFILFR